MQVIPNVINGISGTQSLTSPGHHEVIFRVYPMAFVLSFLAIVHWRCTKQDNEIHTNSAPGIDSIDLSSDNSMLSVNFSEGVFNATDDYQRALGTGLLSITLQLGWQCLTVLKSGG